MGVIMNERDLISATKAACDQLTRYAGSIFCVELLDVLEQLTIINDDLYHARSYDLIQAQITEAKLRLDRLSVFILEQLM